MTDDYFYSLKQLSDLSFSYDLSLYDNDFIGDWIEETFEAERYNFNDIISIGTHAYTVEVTFQNIEDAVAFKLKWG